eukprot:comp21371_c1_seq1/m.29376 comp21371_c1_seq1/g.29376  ORF comp21371_c1_seq1/g.29376 comp21371_c1_seq1/m.29376 type:complete len:113 (-) comp21371_c1_seq1:103-441(-)
MRGLCRLVLTVRALPVAGQAARGLHVSRAAASKFNEAAEHARYTGGRTKQMNPKPAIELISNVVPIEVDGHTAACDGGGGALGHPKVFINLDKSEPQSCGYCGLRFVQKHHH